MNTSCQLGVIEIDFEMDVVVSGPESWQYGKTILTIFIIIIFGILLEVVSNGLLYGIFIYEKYGVDSQRRTMTNMFLSQICIACIFLNILAYPFLLYGMLLSTDGIGYLLAVWTGFLMRSLYGFIGFCMSEIMILKCLYLTKWPMMALLNDNYLATFVGLTNILISILISSVQLGMGELDTAVIFQKLRGVIREKTHLQETVAYW